MSRNITPANTLPCRTVFKIHADGAKHLAAALNMLVDSITLASAAERARASVFNVLRNAFHVVRSPYGKPPDAR